MAFVHPNTVIKILRNVPLDKTYRDTLTIGNSTSTKSEILSAQIAYFTGKAKYTFSTENFTYQRVTDCLKVELIADNLWDCNYIMFQNSDWSGKWFYAFITRIEYINEKRSDIYFELDVMQTWYTDYELKSCFVAREHVSVPDDDAGNHTVPEGLELGEYLSYTVDTTNICDHDQCDIAVAQIPTAFDGIVYDGVFSGLHYTRYPQNDPSVLDSVLTASAAAGQEDTLRLMFMMPSAIAATIPLEGRVRDSGELPEVLTASKATALNGYTPRNKKLLTFPYTFLMLTDRKGLFSILRYEYFDTDSIEVRAHGNVSASPTVYFYPINYKGFAKNYEEGIAESGFPMCAWKYDVFANWLAQNDASLRIGAINNFISTGVGMASGNNGALMGGISSALSNIATIENQMVMPDQARGNVGSGSAAYTMDLLSPVLVQKYIRSEYAQRIDQFFDVYGHKIGRVKVPNILSRPSWNYIQTVDCTATGSVPFNDLSAIKRIYDKGITFWHGDYVGDYSRNNR